MKKLLFRFVFLATILFTGYALANPPGTFQPLLLGGCSLNTTWSPTDKNAAITLSSNNTIATGSGAAYTSVRATTSFSTGKRYYENKIIALGGAGSGAWIGFGNSAFSLASFIGNSNISFGEQGSASGFQASSGGGLALTGAAFNTAVNDIAQVAIDFDAGKFWLGLNNVYKSSGNPSAGTNPFGTFTANPTFFPSSSFFDSSNSGQLITKTVNFPPPTSFQIWDCP